MIKSLSAVVISYNEAPMLEVTLPKLRDSVDQVVIVDMESTDDSESVYRNILSSRDVVVKYARRNLFDFGFAHPRNFGSNFADGEWIFAIDSDELVVPEQVHRFRQMHPRDTRLFRITRRNYYRTPEFTMDNIPELIERGGYSEEAHRRIALNRPEIQWQGTIHEELWDGAGPPPDAGAASGIMLHHLNGLRSTPEEEKQGLYYYLTLRAVAFPRFRYGTNDFWFDQFTREHLDIMLKLSDEFCDRVGIDRLSHDRIRAVLAG